MAEQGLRTANRASAPRLAVPPWRTCTCTIPLAALPWKSCTCTRNAQQALCSASARTCTPTQHQQQRQCLIRGLAPKAQAPRPPVKFAHNAAAHSPSTGAVKQFHNQVQQTCNQTWAVRRSECQSSQNQAPRVALPLTTITAPITPVNAQRRSPVTRHQPVQRPTAAIPLVRTHALAVPLR